MDTCGLNTSLSMSILGMSTAMALLMGIRRKLKPMADSSAERGLVAAVRPSRMPLPRLAPFATRSASASLLLPVPFSLLFLSVRM
jgi:hypothetical protein